MCSSNFFMEKDSLTGLYTHNASLNLIAEKLEMMHYENSGGLIIIDINSFRTINNRYGHFTGDSVLKNISELLLSTFDADSVTGRLGGDEFIVFTLLPNGKGELEKICRKLLASAAAMSIDGDSLEIQLNIGAIEIKSTDDFAESYRIAEAELIKSKQTNTPICIY